MSYFLDFLFYVSGYAYFGIHFFMSHDRNECIPIYFFELNLTTLTIDKFQLTEEHDQSQNILEVHSLSM